jgi:hypothetical protein
MKRDNPQLDTGDFIYILYGKLKSQLLTQYSIAVDSDWESRVLLGETPSLPPPVTRRLTEIIPTSRPKLVVLGKR